MAVSACDVNPSSSKSENKSNSGRNCESPCSSNGIAPSCSSKKEKGKKPEMPRYRPGMFLQNKSLKSDDSALKADTTASDTDKIVSEADMMSKTEGNTDSSSSAEKLSKNVRNRRPDIQVYMPKGKVAAKLNEKKQDTTKSSGPAVKHEEKCEVSHSTKSNHSKLRQSELKNTLPPLEKELCNKNLSKCSNSSSPQPSGSWADLMEASDLLNARSTPDETLCNGNSKESHPPKTTSQKKESNIKNSGNERKRRQRSRQNSLRNDPQQSNQNEELHTRNSVSNQKQFIDSNHPISSEKRKPINRNRHVSGNSDRNVSNRSPVVPKENSITNFHSQNRNGSLENKVTSEKKKRDWVDPTIPPRFQKNKNLNSNNLQDNSTSQSGIGGILKLPVQLEVSGMHSNMLEDTFCKPPVFPEAPSFIHKQLFDPNNPSKPEIVNIPAPVPSPYVPYARMSPPYYASDSLSTYISPPVASTNFIPPPQPPTMNHQYNFLQPDINISNVSSPYSNVREGSPMQCPIQSSPMHVYPRPPATCYTDIPAIVNEPTKRRLKPIVEKNLHEIVLLEKELSSLISKGSFDTNLNALKQCRWKLQLRFENIILADPKYCAEKNPEQSLWKAVFHQIIESLRKKLDENPTNSEEIKENLLNIVLEGTMFYENLLEKQQETYGFKLSKVLELEHISSACLPDQLRCVLISVQKGLIYLGDLARYKETVNQTTNYGKARSWYLKAQQIAPKNGRPYHQLAILAFNTKRKLDAVYYYMRSLAASNPFLSAKECLLTLFDEAKRKYEQYEKKRTPQNAPKPEVVRNFSERCEIWIKHDGSSNVPPVDNEMDSSDLKKLSDVELNKMFVTSFLHVHGKLFTKVGMETFPDVLKNMLREFYILLHRAPLPLTSTRILQLLAMNIFSVTNSSLKENGREQGGSSVLQEQALYTGMSMMSLLMDRCQLLYTIHQASPEYPSKIINDDLAQLLPAVKIWTDWMSCQKCLWAPPPTSLQQKLDFGFNKDAWCAFADLLTAFREVDLSNPAIINQRTNDAEPIILDEDSTFAGFVPLLEAIHTPAFAVQPFDKEKAKHSLRISRIQFFGDYLCGISPAYMEFDIESKKFVSLVTAMTLEESFERSVLLSSTDESFREESFDESLVEESPHHDLERDELQALWSRKEALSKAKEQQEKHKAQIQAVLMKHQRPIVLKIKPKYLIPDTNCFIDHLNLFRKILSSSDFHLVIPLVVINELDGLARGTRVNDHSTPEHASRVTIMSREAVYFLEQQFASRHPHLRSITSKGSVLDTISFRSEEMDKNKGTNDDLILSCCLYYCKDRAEAFMPKNRDDPVTLFREVVLLTDDRNLRVKALAHHVPVRDLLSFLQWANS